MINAPSVPLAEPRPCVAILGVPFDCVTMNEAISIIEKMIESRQPHYLATANVDFVVRTLKDDELRRILFDAHLVVCDGAPLLWASRWLGNPLPERISGADLVPILLRMATLKSHRVFFLGGRPEINQDVLQTLQRRHPGLIVAGSLAPAIQPLHEMDHEAIVAQIKEQRPDMLLVAFGSPKQEKWISMHYRSLGVPVCLGVGSTLEALLGDLPRSPRWMQALRLEWLYRLCEWPGRVFKRYVRDFWVFGGAVYQQASQMRRPRAASTPPPAPVAAAASMPGATGYVPPIEPDILTLPPHLDAAFIASPQNDWEERGNRTPLLFADTRQVTFVDSTGVGSLVRLQKRLREQGGQLVLFGGSDPLQRALKLMKLDTFFPYALDLNAARRLAAQRERERESPVKWGRAGAGAQIAWSGEITSNTIDRLWQQTEEILIDREHDEAEVVVDLSKVTFLDSAGLGSMVRMRRTARQSGVQLRFINPSDAIARVLRVSRLGDFLLGDKA